VCRMCVVINVKPATGLDKLLRWSNELRYGWFLSGLRILLKKRALCRAYDFKERVKYKEGVGDRKSEEPKVESQKKQKRRTENRKDGLQTEN
jgi:hypothetical protein